MVNTVGIRFPNSGKTYCFKAKDMELSTGDRVVVESELGISIGTIAKTTLKTDSPEDKLRPVLRKVTAADLKQEEENDGVRNEASAFCKERIHGRELPMKLITTDVTLDRKRFIFYFTADSRIDFRELVKDLASKFRSRIELRQIGVRDAAKMAGGYGVCGKEICCKTWLRSFAPISIKMAKQQDLILNTCKLSGLCGRLLCCLNYEYEEGAVKRRRQKKQVPASAEAKAAAVDAALAEAVKTPAEKAPQMSEPDPQAKPAKADSSSERQHFKKGRRSRRSRASRRAKATGDSGESKAAAETASPVQKQDPGKGDKTAEPKPKSKRRNRRRGRKRRPRNPDGSGGNKSPQSTGGQGTSGSSGSSGTGGTGSSSGSSGSSGSGGSSSSGPSSSGSSGGSGSPGGSQDNK